MKGSSCMWTDPEARFQLIGFGPYLKLTAYQEQNIQDPLT